MKLKILQETLSKALNNASRFTTARAQLPILGNIKLEATKTKLLVSSTNLEVSLAVSLNAQVEQIGDIAIPSKVITEIVSNLQSGTITLTAEKEQLKISTPGFSSSVSGMNTSDFPSIPQKLDPKNSISLPKEEFSNAMSQVLFSTSIDETRPILTGVLLIFRDADLVVVGTDGFRLSQRKIKLSGKTKNQIMVIPKIVLSEISKMSSEEGSLLLEYNKDENQVVLGVGDVVLATRILEGEFPDYEKIIPKNSSIKVNTDKDEFLRAIKLASVFARDSANIVKISIDKSDINVSAESQTSGNQKTKVDAKIEGGKLDIAFNYRFLEEFIHSIKSEEIQMEFSNQNAPGVFSGPIDKDYFHLIMPVKIQG